METRTANKLGPFIVLTFIYFIVGFLTTVNGQCQGPLKSAFLADAGALKNTFITLISFFFFLGRYPTFRRKSRFPTDRCPFSM